MFRLTTSTDKRKVYHCRSSFLETFHNDKVRLASTEPGNTNFEENRILQRQLEDKPGPSRKTLYLSSQTLTNGTDWNAGRNTVEHCVCLACGQACRLCWPNA